MQINFSKTTHVSPANGANGESAPTENGVEVNGNGAELKVKESTLEESLPPADAPV